MKTRIARARFLAVLALWLVSAHQVAAQRAQHGSEASTSSTYASGIGAILDWLGRLSGPGPFVRGGLTYAGPTTGSFQARLTVLGGTTIDSPFVRVVSVQPTVSLVHGSFEVATGVGANLFFGDGFATFVQVSAPLQLVYRVGPRIHVGAGVNYFGAFRPGAFGPSVPRLEPEAVMEIFVRVPIGASRP